MIISSYGNALRDSKQIAQLAHSLILGKLDLPKVQIVFCKVNSLYKKSASALVSRDRFWSFRAGSPAAQSRKGRNPERLGAEARHQKRQLFIISYLCIKKRIICSKCNDSLFLQCPPLRLPLGFIFQKQYSSYPLS